MDMDSIHITNTADIDSLQDILDQFDGFVVDQFGVLHDGEHPYPSAISSLQLLMNAGKRIVVLSNSGKRSEINIQRMARLGFKRELFSEFVTSGDVAFEKVKTLFVDKGVNRCYLIARDGDASAVEGLDINLVSHPDHCDFIIISACESERYSEQHYSDLLRQCARRQVPCLCTNPDKLMLTRDGIKFGAGRIAEIFEKMGGTVKWIGKPYPEIYEHALRFLPDIPRQRILCIGDSIEHDIAGGKKAGLKTLFVRGGIHRDMDDEQIFRYIQDHQALPDYKIQLMK